MLDLFKPSVITANDLYEGHVVYLDADTNWQEDITHAHIYFEQELAEKALTAVDPAKVVGAYLIEVEVNNNQAQPTHFREDFRANGPSGYVYHTEGVKNV